MANRIGRLLSVVFIGVISGFALYLIPAMPMDTGPFPSCLVWGIECVLAAVVPFYVPWLALRNQVLLSLDPPSYGMP